MQHIHLACSDMPVSVKQVNPLFVTGRTWSASLDAHMYQVHIRREE